MEGRFFEDFRVGDKYAHGGRTISDVDNTWFTLLTCNSHEIHYNADFASRTEFGRPIVNSCLTLSLATGLSVEDISRNAVANLGWERVHLLGPLFAGDTLYAESVVLEVRASRSRPGSGIIKVLTRGFNQHGVDVIEFERAILVHGRESSPQRAPVRKGRIEKEEGEPGAPHLSAQTGAD